MKTALICFSDRGAALAIRLCGLLGLPLSDVHSTAKFASKYGFISHDNVASDMGTLFRSHEALIFLCACGIAVRDIAPHLESKAVDPAVLVIDEQARFVISLLSGHIGGANALARSVAAALGAAAVVTTATDGAGRFSCDEWAVKHQCAISSLEKAKAVSAAILTRDLPISSEYPLPATLPAGLTESGTGEIGIYIGIRKTEPYAVTLRLIPRVVTLGIGCRRGIPADAVEKAVRGTLEDAGIDFRAVCAVASIDVKKDEEGLLAFARKQALPISFYSAEALNQVPGRFEESEFVLGTVGCGNVCERAAAMGGGKVIIHKTAANGVTVAAAASKWEAVF